MRILGDCLLQFLSFSTEWPWLKIHQIHSCPRNVGYWFSGLCFHRNSLRGATSAERRRYIKATTTERYQATTLGKLFTPTCLDADSLRYYMVSLKPGTFTFTAAGSQSNDRLVVY